MSGDPPLPSLPPRRSWRSASSEPRGSDLGLTPLRPRSDPGLTPTFLSRSFGPRQTCGIFPTVPGQSQRDRRPAGVVSGSSLAQNALDDTPLTRHPRGLHRQAAQSFRPEKLQPPIPVRIFDDAQRPTRMSRNAPHPTRTAVGQRRRSALQPARLPCSTANIL